LRLHPSDLALRREINASSRKNPYLSFMPNAYPLSEIQSIPCGATVAVQGIGLTAYDIISCLTRARGGEFQANGEGGLTYLASGREPRIILYSRQGLPFCSRGKNEKGIGGQWKARFFTRDMIDMLRSRARRDTGDDKLDFYAQLYPIC
jgi:hypothetical protein